MDSVYVCSECGYESAFYLASCPACGLGTFNEKNVRAAAFSNPARAVAETGEPRVCYKCDYETDLVLTDCPRCGKRLRTASTVRVLGWILLLLGAFLVLFMGAITIVVAGIIAQAGRPGSTQSFDGGPKEMFMIFGIFGLVIAFGFTSMVAGFWQVWYGTRAKHLVKIMLGIAVALLVIGELVQVLF